MITSLIVPPLSPPFPPPVIITSFIHTNKHSVGAFVDSKDLLQLVKELLCFDDWAAGNFKGTASACDWLAAQQSPYHILGGAPAAVSQGGEPGGGATCPLTNSPGTRDPVGGEEDNTPCGWGSALPTLITPTHERDHGGGGCTQERLSACIPTGTCVPGSDTKLQPGDRKLYPG